MVAGLTVLMALVSSLALPVETKAMCDALRDSEPLTASPISDAVAQFRGKRVERDKYEDDAAFSTRVAALTAQFPELAAPRAISFSVDEDRIEYHPGSQEMTFPLGPVSEWCPGIYYGDEAPGSPVCISEVVRSVPGKPYTASNAFGVKALVNVIETRTAGVYLGNEELAGKTKLFRGFDRSVGFKMASEQARRVSQEAEFVIILQPKAPFFVTRSTSSSPKIDMPREERVQASYLAGDIVCSAIRYRATQQTLAYRELPTEDPNALRSPAEPRGNPTSWLTSLDGAFDRIELSLMVGADGRVSNCWGNGQNIGQENKACIIVSRRARFVPAIDDSGQPVPQLYRFKAGAAQ